MDNIFAGPTPRIIGATVYNLNLSYGLRPAQDPGPHETVVEVVDSHCGLIRTAEGNLYSNGEFGIARFAD